MLITKQAQGYSAVGTIEGITVVGEGESRAHALGMAVREYESAVENKCDFCGGEGEYDEKQSDGDLVAVKCHCKLQESDSE